MDYTFTEKETEMMFNWGYTSEIEHGFEAEEQKLYDKLERIFTPLQKEKSESRKIVEFFEEICDTYKGVSYSLRIPGGNCIRFVDIDKDLCFDTKKKDSLILIRIFALTRRKRNTRMWCLRCQK